MPRPSALTTIRTRAASSAASIKPWTLGSERSKVSSALASNPRPMSGATASTRAVHAAASARRSWLGALALGSRRTTRREIQASGAAIRATRAATAARAIFWASVSRSATPPSQLPIRLRITAASIGTSRQTSSHSCGLRTLEDRAKVSRANSWRRAALMRVARSSLSRSMARAARRLASSESCLCFSLASSLAATSVAGWVSPDLGVSSARRFADAASRGLKSAIAPCKARPSASFSARTR